MNDLRNRWIPAVAAPVTVAVLVAGCGGGSVPEADAAQAANDTTDAAPRVAVEVMAVASEPFGERIRIVGDVEADRSVTIAAEEGGVVERLFVEKGEYVDAGAAIAKIDDRTLSAQVAQADANAALAQERHERQRMLWESDEIGTEMAYLEARYAAEQAAANLDLLRTRLERTTVRAPFTAVLDARRVELGSMVSPGTPVARLVDIDTIRVSAGVPERYADDIIPGAAATIEFDRMQGRRFEGEVAFVGAVVNQQNRTFPVEIVVPNPAVDEAAATTADGGSAADGIAGRVIKPGMVANVSILRRTIDAAILVPQDAVMRTPDGYLAYVVVESGDGRDVVRERTVEIGAATGDRVLIRSGLAAGDRLIVVGQTRVADGDAVRIVEGVRGE